MATRKDIALLSGYSLGTVSRVINKRPDVSEKARKRIEEVIRQYDYTPNINAKQMRMKDSAMIAIIVKHYDMLSNQLLLAGVKKNLTDMNNDAFIVMSEDGETENVTATRLMQSINHNHCLLCTYGNDFIPLFSLAAHRFRTV